MKKVSLKCSALLMLVLLVAGVVHAQKVPTTAIQLDGNCVMYAGVDNPITVVVEQTSLKDVTVILEGKGKLTPDKEPGRYLVNPSVDQKTVTLHVRVNTKKGINEVALQRFAVRQIPNPELRIAGFESGNVVNVKDFVEGTAVIPIKSPDYLLKFDNKLMKVVNFSVAVGTREERAEGYRFTTGMVNMIRRCASTGERMYVRAQVIMPDATIRDVSANFILKVPTGQYLEYLDENGEPVFDSKGNPLYRFVEDSEVTDEEEEDEE